MRRLVLALFLYIGLIMFFAVIGVALICGASMVTALQRAFVSLVLMAALGFVAALFSRSGAVTSRLEE